MKLHVSKITDTWIDRSGWSPGPWDDEPDRAEWRDAETGLPCLAIRHPRLGDWCGYVAVLPGHPWHGLDYDAIADDAHNAAHGGLTFAAEYQNDERPLRERVCHMPAPGEPDDVWWLGFDCAHLGDLSPGLEAMRPAFGDLRGRTLILVDLSLANVPAQRCRRPDTYRSLPYVQARCADLALATTQHQKD